MKVIQDLNPTHLHLHQGLHPASQLWRKDAFPHRMVLSPLLRQSLLNHQQLHPASQVWRKDPTPHRQVLPLLHHSQGPHLAQVTKALREECRPLGGVDFMTHQMPVLAEMCR